jgi:hypothetical protein
MKDLYPADIYVPFNALAVTATCLQRSPEVVEKVVAALIEGTACMPNCDRVFLQGKSVRPEVGKATTSFSDRNPRPP